MADPPDGAPPVRHACSLTLNSILELEPPGLQLAKDDGKRHQLAHARRRRQRIGVLLEQHEIGVGIHEHGVLRLGFEGRRRCGGVNGDGAGGETRTAPAAAILIHLSRREAYTG